MLAKIKKRNGNIVPFQIEKIKQAIIAAFEDAQGRYDTLQAEEIARASMDKLRAKFDGNDRVPGVEDVQNAVEAALMDADCHGVAKAYIIYRYEHEKKREEKKKEMSRRIEEDGFYVTKRDGELEEFSLEKLTAYFKRFTEGIENVIDVDALVAQCKVELYENIKTEEIEKTALLVTRSFIEKDPAYSKMSTRILFDSLYKDVIGRDKIDYRKFVAQYREAFKDYIRFGVEIGRLNPKMLVFDLDEIVKHIVPERDDEHTYLSAQTLHDRYFIRNPYTQNILEMPQMFWMRVAMGIALSEDNREEKAVEFYNMLSKLRFVHSTPTLFHSGTQHPQLSSCYLTTVMDDLGHIFKSYGDNAQLAKWSGGLGNDWTNVRATGALIHSTGVESQGVIPFLKIANDATFAINRSGKRRGAAVAYLETWHLDIEDFLELRKNTGDERRRTHDMNTSNWIPDLFMKRVREDGEWTLFSPDEVPDLHHIYGEDFEEAYEAYEQQAREGELRQYKTMPARDLWRKMISMLFETGHPWMTWKDPCNVRSPQDHAGVIHSSNLCTEITLNTSEDETAVCNLGSVNLSRHIKNGKLDTEKLKETVTTAMRMLDNVIDLNFYPTEEARNSNMKHRPIGIGVMGFQDALYKLGINFDSKQAIAFADQSMEVVSYYAIRGSAMLAKEKGTYQSYRGSKWDRGILPIDTLDLLEEERGERIPVSRQSTMEWDKLRNLIAEHGMRNSNTMAIAPTATISNISGCFPTIEPIYKNIYVKSNMSGEFVIVNPYLIADLKRLGMWSEEMLSKLKQHDGSVQDIPEVPAELKAKYKEAFELSTRHMIDIAAHRGKWIDQSQSLNIFYHGTSGKDLSEIYMHAWEMGLKTTYYLRTLGASDIEKSTVQLEKGGETDPSADANPQPQVEPTTQTSDAPAPVSNPTEHPQPVTATQQETSNEPTRSESFDAPAPSPKPLAQKKVDDNLCRLEDPTCEACQ